MCVLKEIPIITFSLWCTRLLASLVCRCGQKVTLIKLEGVHRTLTPRSTAVLAYAATQSYACAMLESGSGPGIGHKDKRQAAISHGRIRRSTRR